MLTGTVANVTVAGVIELSMGAGAGAMRSSAAFEYVLPPPHTSISAVPAVAIDAAGTAAVNCVGLSSAVVRACAFHRSVAPAEKFEPVTVSVNDGPPAVTEVGARAVIAGVPFAVRVRVFDVGNPGRDTDTASVPVFAINAAGMFTRISLASTRIAGKSDPLTCAVVPLTNPAPDIVRVNEGPPTSTAAGLSWSTRSYTDEAISSGIEILTEANLKAANVAAYCDALRIVGQRGDPVAYEPTIVVGTYRPEKEQMLNLSVAGHVLEQLHGKFPATGCLITLDGKCHRVNLRPMYKTVSSILERIRGWCAEPPMQPPPVVLNKHCPYCPFKNVCSQQAEGADDLSLLDRMTPKAIGRYQNKGIFTVKQLSFLFKPRRRRRRRCSM